MTAPVVFISYSHDSAEHKDRILALSNRLRRGGIACMIDQYQTSPEVGWPTWCQKQVEDADFVLVACTETYSRRFRMEESPGRGRGSVWEAHAIAQQLYNSAGRNTKFIPIIFSDRDAEFVPVPLQGASRYLLDKDYEPLYRQLTQQPLIEMPPVGEIERMLPQPVLERKSDFDSNEKRGWPANRALLPLLIGFLILAFLTWCLPNFPDSPSDMLTPLESQSAAKEYRFTMYLQTGLTSLCLILAALAVRRLDADRRTWAWGCFAFSILALWAVWVSSLNVGSHELDNSVNAHTPLLAWPQRLGFLYWGVSVASLAWAFIGRMPRETSR